MQSTQISGYQVCSPGGQLVENAHRTLIRPQSGEIANTESRKQSFDWSPVALFIRHNRLG
jgi:hypothetical protein